MRVWRPACLVYAEFLGSISLLTSLLLGVVSFAIGARAGFVAVIPTALTGDRGPPAPLRGIG